MTSANVWPPLWEFAPPIEILYFGVTESGTQKSSITISGFLALLGSYPHPPSEIPAI